MVAIRIDGGVGLMPGDMVVVSAERLAALERVAKKAAEYRQLVLTLLAKKEEHGLF
jgi:hypothetical protein